ncbi:MAG TPA: DUF3566 domain-containing protein [Mycobacteriales bacterium]|nr:DUF3566 domain-containing protein [Mycobacteriales bacterium]
MTIGSGEPPGFDGGSLSGGPAGVARGPLRADPSAGMAGSLAQMSSSATVVPGGAAGRATVTVGAASVARKRGRRARLTLKRIDPWSTLKFSLVYGLVGMIVLVVAVVLLYGVIDAMGVIESLRKFLADVSDSSNGSGLSAWLSFSRVMIVAAVVGLVNVVLFAAFATLTAFIYNVCTDITGGVEVTLSERE